MTAIATSEPATWNRERFEHNLAAVGQLQPELARRLADLELPKTIEPSLGRDDTPTFRLLGEDQRLYWLGRTSMPSISAPAAIENFAPGVANVLMPIVGTGLEIDLMCKRVPRYCAVFAYDADPVNVKLALHVTDLAGHLRDGRLILLTFDPIEEALPAFLAEHPGYDFPHRMLRHPAISREAIDRLRMASETAAVVTTERQLQTAREVADALARTHKPTVGDHPRVTVLSSDPGSEAMTTVGRLTGALAELGWPAAVQAPSSPNQCHNLARLLLVRDHQPDLVMTFNSCTGRLTGFIPAAQPVASWFWPGSVVGPAVEEGYGAGHHLFAATPDLCEQLRAAGVSPERTHLLEVGVDTNCYRSVEIDPERRKQLSCDVAILADAVDGSPAAVGIKHHSQVALWNAIRELTDSHAHRYTSSLAPKIVADAEHRTGVKMTADDVREKFVRLLQLRLAKTAVVRAVVTKLRRLGVSVKVWGSGWGDIDNVCDVVVGHIPDPLGANEIYQCATAVVFPVFDDSAARMILEVTASGGVIIFKRSEIDLGRLHPQTAEVFDLLPQYNDLGTLATRVREAGIPNGQCVLNAAAAREQVATKHSLTQRWMTIRDTLRGCG